MVEAERKFQNKAFIHDEETNINDTDGPVSKYFPPYSVFSIHCAK